MEELTFKKRRLSFGYLPHNSLTSKLDSNKKKEVTDSVKDLKEEIEQEDELTSIKRTSRSRIAGLRYLETALVSSEECLIEVDFEFKSNNRGVEIQVTGKSVKESSSYFINYQEISRIELCTNVPCYVDMIFPSGILRDWSDVHLYFSKPGVLRFEIEQTSFRRIQLLGLFERLCSRPCILREKKSYEQSFYSNVRVLASTFALASLCPDPPLSPSELKSSSERILDLKIDGASLEPKTPEHNGEHKIRSSSLLSRTYTNNIKAPEVKTPPVSFEPAPIRNPQLLFIYMEGTPMAVAITSAELPRLQPGIFLNDRLIDFDLALSMCSFHKAEFKVQVFSSFFYGQLKAKGPENLEKWAGDEDIFKMDYLVIPINEHLHWYLAIVCHPERILDLEGHSSEQDLEEAEQDHLEISPCTILILDSLGLKTRGTAASRIKTYLIREAQLRRSTTISSLVIVKYPQVPLQTNLTDCGLFVGEYFERFIQSPDSFEEKALLGKSDDLFTALEASGRRSYLAASIKALAEQYQVCNPINSGPIDSSGSSDLEEISHL